tara:strand:- start:391 stop:618 length:228 start_codon:yes stop_codon:yes gene_type:complete
MDEFKLLTILSKELVLQLDIIEKKASALKNQINQEGISVHHSINNDILETATKIYKVSALLGYLKTFKLEIKELK